MLPTSTTWADWLRTLTNTCAPQRKGAEHVPGAKHLAPTHYAALVMPTRELYTWKDAAVPLISRIANARPCAHARVALITHVCGSSTCTKQGWMRTRPACPYGGICSGILTLPMSTTWVDRL